MGRGAENIVEHAPRIDLNGASPFGNFDNVKAALKADREKMKADREKLKVDRAAAKSAKN